MIEVRNRKLTEKGRRSYQVENLVKSCKSRKTSLVGTLRKKLMLRESCSEISTWKQDLVRLKSCGMKLEILVVKSEKSIKTISSKMWRLSGSNSGVNGMTLKGMQGMKFNTCSKQYWILVLSALRVLRRVN